MSITALQTPTAGSFILDANNTLIKVQSTNGAGHYFRAQISVNGTLFDTQGWSREDDYTAIKDLKKMYQAYFETVFLSDFENLLQVQTHLVKEVAIVVKEYNIDSGAETSSLTLPAFFIMYNIKPQLFDYTAPLKLLSESVVMTVPVNGKIAFPFYVGTTATTLSVNLATDDGTTLDSRGISIAKGGIVYLYQFDLAPETLSYSVLSVVATIQVNGGAAIRLRFRINRLPDFPVKELAFKNNFGFFQYAYPDGEMQTQSGLEVLTYTLEDDTEKVYEINEEATYTINTGSYKADEAGVLSMIALSPETYLKNGSAWLPVVTGTKKLTTFRDRQHQYSEALLFTMRKGTDIENSAYISGITNIPNIELVSVINDGANHLTFNYKFNNGFVAAQLRLKYKPASQANYASLNPFVPTAPTGTFTMSVNTAPTVILYYLEEYGNPTNRSNIKTVTIV